MPYYPFSPQIGCEYTLTAPDGTTCTFNNPAASDYVGMLYEVTGLDSPEVRESATELAEADGGSHGYFYFGRRPITMNCRVFGHASVLDRDLKLDRLRRIVHQGMRADLILGWHNDPTDATLAMQTWVRLQQPLRITGAWVKEASMQFVSEFAPLFSQAAHSATFGVGTASGTSAFYNSGNAPSAPVVNFSATTGTILNPSMTRLGGLGSYLYTTGLSLNAGETLSIDVLTHTARFTAGTRNGQSGTRYLNFTASDWPMLQPGGNSLQMNTQTGTNGNMQVVYRDTWL